jgi:hypothetical protein
MSRDCSLLLAIRRCLRRIGRYLNRYGKNIGYAMAILVGSLLLLGLIQNWKHINWSNYRLDARYLIISLIPHALGLGLGGLGWALIVQRMDSGQDLWRSFHIYFLSNVGRNLPGGVWHIAGRIYLHKRAGASRAVTAFATGVELVLAALAGAVVYVIGLLVRPGAPLVPRGVLIALLFLGGVILYPPVFNKLTNWFVRRSVNENRAPVAVKISIVLGWVALYTVIIFIGGVVLFLLGNAIYPLDWRELPNVAGAWGISMAVSGLTFWIPIRIGIRDGVLVMALSAQMPFSAALVITAVWRIWIPMSEMFWAFIAACIGRLRSGRVNGDGGLSV